MLEAVDSGAPTMLLNNPALDKFQQALHVLHAFPNDIIFKALDDFRRDEFNFVFDSVGELGKLLGGHLRLLLQYDRRDVELGLEKCHRQFVASIQHNDIAGIALPTDRKSFPYASISPASSKHKSKTRHAKNKPSTPKRHSYTCPLCRKYFTRDNDWLTHYIKYHEQYELWECEACHNISYDQSDFNQHHRHIHKCEGCEKHAVNRCGKRIYMACDGCDDCNQHLPSSSKKKEYKVLDDCNGCKHAEAAHRALCTPTAYGCGFCGRLWADRKSYKSHLKDDLNKRPALQWVFSRVIRALLYGRLELREPFWERVEKEHGLRMEDIPLIYWEEEGNGDLLRELLSWESGRGLDVVMMAYERGKRVDAASTQPAFSLARLPNATIGELQEAAPTTFPLSPADAGVPGFNSHADVSPKQDFDFVESIPEAAPQQDYDLAESTAQSNHENDDPLATSETSNLDSNLNCNVDDSNEAWEDWIDWTLCI